MTRRVSAGIGRTLITAALPLAAAAAFAGTAAAEPLALTPAIEHYTALLAPGGTAEVGRTDAEAALQAVRTCLRHLPR